ncbi:HPr(Ser) kinase/phosphatase [Ignavibacteria bacterium]|nr:HPr kinase/phosphorylase [Bacteroidota bacterium]MCZ2132548.1 HPr(Ser) kinase/phosphatase [Bacteroidota bacterium]
MSLYSHTKIVTKDKISVEALLSAPVYLKKINGETGLNNNISDKNLHRPQLALAGFTELFTYHRVQIFGNTEIYYLKSLTREQCLTALRRVAGFPIPAIILTNRHEMDGELLSVLNDSNIAVFAAEAETTKTITLLSEFLDDQFAEQMQIHGSFVDVYGVGVLLTGRSGIGKSEIALDLIERGHRLVADDVVIFTKKRDNILMGTGQKMSKHFMEIRGLGIINVQRMFGVRAIRFQKRLEIIVELEVWDKEAEYTRTGLDEKPMELMGVNVANVKLPIFPGKNVTVITEVIALNYLLKTYGYSAADDLTNIIHREIALKRHSKSAGDPRLINYFQSDDE